MDDRPPAPRAAPDAEAQHGLHGPPPRPDLVDEQLVDWQLVRGWATFILGAPRRHKLYALTVVAACLGAAVALVVSLPRSYHTQARILASRNLVMPALGNPGRAIPTDADAPTRAAAETILRRDNILALIDQTNLLKHWESTRAPAARAKDWVLHLARGPLDPEEKREALVYVLERNLWVNTGDGTIDIAIDWPDAKMGYQLVTLAQQNFLEARHALEVSTIAEAISILEGHAAAARTQVDHAMEELKRERDAQRSSFTPAPRLRAPVPAAAPLPQREDPELQNLRLMLVAKRNALRDLEDFRQRRLAELQAVLTEQSATYTPVHPLVVATRESIESLQRDSPQLAALKREEQELQRQYTARGGKDVDADRLASAAVEPAAHVQMPSYLRDFRTEVPTESDAAQYWRTQLDFAISKYEGLVARIEAAKIELDTARAAFKYRYSIIRPAEVSKKPSKPKIPLLLAGGLVGGVFLAFALSALRDLRRGLVLQAWQVEHQLELPVVARLHEP